MTDPTTANLDLTESKAPTAPKLDTPQARAQAMTETMVKAGTVPTRFRDENGNVNQTFLFQTYLAMEKGEDLPAASAATDTESGGTSEDAATSAATAQPASMTAKPTSEAQTLSEALAEPKLPEGVNPWEEAQKQLRDNGEVTPEIVTALKAQGATDAALAAMAHGFKAKQTSDMETAHAVCGDKAGFDKTIQWAKDNLSPEELRLLDTGLKSDHAIMVLTGLHAQAQANPADGGQVNTADGGTNIAPSGALQPFESQEDVIAHQRDPKYKTDPAFRRMTEARLYLMKGATHDQLREMGLIK